MSAKDIYAAGGTKVCSKCGVEQPVDRDHFGSCNGGRNVRGVCRSCIRANSKKHHHENPDQMRARVQKSRARRTVLSWGDTAELRRLVRTQNNKCGYCGEHMTVPTVDHRIPVSRGGTDDLSNLIAACGKCNSNKRDKTEAEYREFLKKVAAE